MRILLALLLCLLWTGALSAQTLQPGDTISVSVYQDPKLDRQLVVSPTGTISFPLVGQIKVNGLTTTGLEAALKSKLRDKFTTDLDISVTVIDSKAVQLGDRDRERQKERAIAREERERERQIAREERDRERELSDADLKPRVFVTGEVLRPGPFVIRIRMNVLQALSAAGGFGLFAAKHRVQIRRQIAGQEVMYLFNYPAFHSGKDVTGNIDVLPGDVIIVPEKGLFD